jgi:hypothetical protein
MEGAGWEGREEMSIQEAGEDFRFRGPSFCNSLI